MPLVLTTLEIRGQEVLLNLVNGYEHIGAYPAPTPQRGPEPDFPNIIAAGANPPSVTQVNITPARNTYGADLTDVSEAISYMAEQGWNLAFVVASLEVPYYYFTH